MDRQLFKEPAAVFVMGAIAMILFLFVESRIRGEKKSYRDYIVYGVFVGAFGAFLTYMSHGYRMIKMGDMMGGKKNYLINRFPV